jgi:hypothetical protein
MNAQKRMNALSAAIGALADMHGSVVGNPAFQHNYEPRKCTCAYGQSIRVLAIMRGELYEELRATRKKKYDLNTGAKEKEARHDI